MSIREIINEIDTLEAQMSDGRLKAFELKEWEPRTWAVAFMGRDGEDNEYVVAFDPDGMGRVSSNPKADAKFFALVRNNWRAISAAAKGGAA